MSKAAGAVILAVGAIAAVIAVVVSFIPFSHAGTAEPTAAFRAQKSLDEVLFKLASSPAAKYTGSVTQEYGGQSIKYDFTNMVVTISNSAEGTISVNGNQGEYRQVGNSRFVNAPAGFWTAVLSSNEKERKDLGPLAGKWVDSSRTSVLPVGNTLAPDILAGTIGTVPADQAPKLGPIEVASPNPGLPDARFWPVSDPPVTFVGDNVVKIGQWEVTFDPSSKVVTHVKGTEVTDEGSDKLTTTYDLDVATQSADDAAKLFANQRALVNDLVNVPAPGYTVDSRAVAFVPGGNCTRAACPFTYTGSGTVSPTATGTGYVNYGLTVNFTLNGRPAAAPCTTVIRADFGATGRATCVARNIVGEGTTVRGVPTWQYLPFRTNTVDALNDQINKNQERTKQQVTFVRTGSKQPEAAAYGSPRTGLPSYYVIQRGDYLFDGLGPLGDLLVMFAPGYATHVVNGQLDPSWAGTTTIKDQITKQVAAANGTRVLWFVAEPSTAVALEALVREAGQSDKIEVSYIDPNR
ncbi:hypothetical protein [Gordonia sp. ABSL49_1]|uniref:hypothetical protein n=1 Tax=Gordonia sp. ABSL49_1 TaxID=2920941 RepID=UPI001F0CE034|nr:hypothetical protein [Gordonia sp. ABSL49_1]MCH5641832.1 hypothetical protein [Gordonia sp. ABSL49_1]